jgi:hypothetical protein
MNTQTIETKKIFLTPDGSYFTDSLYSNLSYNIPYLFSKDPNLLYNSIKVLHCEIPFSWYIINSNNNKLILSTGTITLSQGNYNANSFITMVQPLLPTGMVITFDNITGVFTFSHISSFSILSTSTCYKIIGMSKNTSYSSVSNVILMPFMANFLGTKNIYINIPNLSLDNFNSGTKTYSTLLCIQVNAPPYGIIFYENKSGNKNIIKGIKDDILQIQILDDDFNSINFNNTEWSITLEIESCKNIIFIPSSTL